MEANPRRIAGLDSIRFLCAAIVMLGHIGLLNSRMLGSSHTGIATIVVGVFNCLFNGPAAVIVFFVISGFCIHFPFRGQRVLSVPLFFARRFIRILPPAIIVVLILKMGLKAQLNPEDSVLWSVICEGIYYLIYPVLLHLRRKSSWPLLIGISFSCAFALLATHVRALNLANHEYIALGSATWVIGLPCWLLGCWLAEEYRSFRLLSHLEMWFVRIAIYGTSVLLRICMFHISSPLASNCVMLDLFAIAVYFWIGVEIVYAANYGSVRVLEWSGGWSYSLYLVHPSMGIVLSAIGLSFIETGATTHFLANIISLFASYGFYLLVERPARLLAVAVGRALSPEVPYLAKASLELG